MEGTSTKNTKDTRNDSINDSKIRNRSEFSRFFRSILEFNFQVCIMPREILMDVFDIFQSRFFSRRSRTVKHFCGRACKRDANKTRAKYDELMEWLSEERSAYTPEAFAVHRAARDNTRKRTRYVMVRWRSSG